MAYVVALDSFRRSLEAEGVGELAESRVGLPAIGHPHDALLFERVLGVPLGELGEVALLATLRHQDPDGAAAALRSEGLECARFWYRGRNDDLRGHRGGDRIVLAKERCEHIRRERALRSLERKVVAAGDRAVAHAEDLDDGVALGDGCGVHVEVITLVRVHLLPVEGAFDRDEPIAECRRALERERVRRLVHLLLCLARERFVPALEEEHAPVDRPAVLVARRVAYAGRGAALEVEQKARSASWERRWRHGPSTAVLSRDDIQFAGAVREELLKKIERLID